MTWRTLPAGEFDAIAPDWQALNARACAGHPLLDPAFIGPLLKHFGSGRERIALHEGPNGLECAVILGEPKLGTWQSFAPSQAPLALFVAGRSTDWTTIGQLAPSLDALAWIVGLARYDERYCMPLPVGLPSIEVRGYATTMSIEVGRTFADYWEERPKKLRSNIARYFRRLEKEGIRWRLDEIAATDQLRPAVGAYGDLESAGWKGRTGSAVHRDNTQGRFYADVLEQFGATGEARAFNLYFDDRLVSSRLAIWRSGILVFLKTTYDEEYAKFAAGRLLLYLVMERIFAIEGQHVTEFYTKASVDQLQWASASREICHVNLFRWNMLRQLIGTARNLRPRRLKLAADSD